MGPTLPNDFSSVHLNAQTRLLNNKKLMFKMKKLILLVATICSFNSLFAQIPNPGFEMWDSTATYHFPIGWDNLDSATNLAGVYTCTQMPGYAGAHAIKLVSHTVALVSQTFPGVAVSGKIDYTTGSFKSGFAYSARPANLSGAWQYMPFSGDTGHIIVFLTKWNSGLNRRDTIAFTDQQMASPDMVMSWATFSIPLTYHSNQYPDSGVIVLTSSGAHPVNNSYLYVDTLQFTGSVTTGVELNSATTTKFNLYPNPTNNATSVIYDAVEAGTVNVSVTSVDGREVYNMSKNVTVGGNKFEISMTNAPKGLYLVKLTDETGTETRKLVIE
jgi:hypothetical protein